MEVLNKERAIKEKALELGFDRAGIARAEVPGEARTRFQGWLSRGFAADMTWMGRNAERRMDPSLPVPGARSAVVVAKNYNVEPPKTTDGGEGRAKISRYAWGRDYHDLMKPRLKALYEWIAANWPAAEGRYYVDDGPVLEKTLARQAGLGWIGKHTNLIDKAAGSWFFLGEILLTLELEPDAPSADHCGECVACIEACPTGAIVEPYVLDARRCISYQTIEKRGSMDADVRVGCGDWAFGCDVCQEVCPWNRDAPVTDWLEFQPGPAGARPAVRDLLKMSVETFRAVFRGSPVRRAKWNGLLRNALAVVENDNLFTALGEVEKLTRHEDPLVRSEAVRVLLRLTKR